MNEQEELIEFDNDMKELLKCTTSNSFGNGMIEISCKLGNWSVVGPYSMILINQAMHYFELYKKDGEYDIFLKSK